MVNCPKCGAKNAEDSDFCTTCGAKMQVTKSKLTTKGEEFGRKAEAWGRRMEARSQEECFGLPGGGAVCGALFGLLIIILGLSIVTTIPFWFYIGPIVVLMVGVLVVVASIYAYRASKKRA